MGKQVIVSKPKGFNLTEAEYKYAALLADPCNGPLVAGCFGDGSGGMVSRFESDGILGDGTGVTSTALAFVPGAAAAWTSGTNSDFATPVWNGVSASLVPGGSFLTTNSGQFRCLAACVQVYWPGTEFNRQGLVSMVQTTANVVNNASANVAAIRAASTHVCRMPENYVELKWVPSEWELEMRSKAVTASHEEFSRFSALLVTFSGLPPATPVRYRMVGVYEWVPAVQVGLAAINTNPAPSQGQLNRVLAYLGNAGRWAYTTSHQAAGAVSNLVAGGRAAYQLGSGLLRLAG